MLRLLRNTAIILMLTFSSQGHAMGLFDVFTIYVFSEVRGVVTLDGKPAEGAEIIRIGDHEEDKVYTDRAVTDAAGRFEFGPISTFSLRPIMLGTIIRQKIEIKYQGNSYLAWDTVKRNNHRYGELNDEGVDSPIKLNLTCELMDSQEGRTVIQMEIRKVGIYGLCTWEGQPEGKE